MQFRCYATRGAAFLLAVLCMVPARGDQVTDATTQLGKLEMASVVPVCKQSRMNDRAYAARCHAVSDRLMTCLYIASEAAALRDMEKTGTKTWGEIEDNLRGDPPNAQTANAWRALGIAQAAPATESTYHLAIVTYKECAGQVNVAAIVRPTSTPMDHEKFLDLCVNRMGASPEYAWAFAHPQVAMTGDALSLAETGVLYDFAWPGSPGGTGPVIALHASNGPATPIGESANQKAENLFQTEAVILAGAYHELHDRLVRSGSSEADATKAATSEVTKDARVWCDNATKLSSFAP